jgi:phosphate transport system substrate-binding protein
VAGGRYPSPPARPLYLQTKGRFKGPAKEFIRWILTEGQKHVDENGYVRLGGSQIAEAVRTLEK